MDLNHYFKEYENSHQNVWNRRCHLIGIPLIVVSILLLVFQSREPWVWWMFGIGWVFQFIGHGIERTMPEFMKNPIYLLIGPMYFVHKLTSKKKKSA